MPSSLLKSAPTQVNFSGTTRRIFSNSSDATSLNGAASTLEYLTIPDGSGEQTFCITNSGANATTGAIWNTESRIYTGRMALAVYLDDFGSAAGVPNYSSTAFHQTQLTVTIDNDGTIDNSSHLYNVMLNRGWNVVQIGRAYATNSARNGSATVLPTVGGVGVVGTPGSAGSATYSSSVFDAAVGQLRVTVGAAGVDLFNRVFFKEIVDNYQTDSKTCLIFDDARDTVHSVAFPLMQNRGLVGVLPIISSFVGTPGYMTIAQIEELFRAGWDIVNHTRSHLPAATMAGFTQAQCLAEIVECDQFIQANGWNRNNSNKYFVAPFGAMQRMDAVNYRAAIQEAGVVASFGTTNRCIGGQLISPYFIPRLDFNTLNAGTGYAIATMVDQYTQAVMNGCSPMVMLHQFVNVPTDSTMLAALELETFLDRVQALDLAGFTSVEGVTTAIPALAHGVNGGIRNLR
jgi:hypothetical protein